MQPSPATLDLPPPRRRRRRRRGASPATRWLAGFAAIGLTQLALGLLVVMLVRAAYQADADGPDLGVLLAGAFVYALAVAFAGALALSRRAS